MKLKKIAILSALEKETVSVWENLGDFKLSKIGAYKVNQGTIGHWSVVGMSTGVGKVRSAAGTQFIMDQFRPDLLLFVGLGGALSPRLKIGDILIAEKTLQIDFDIKPFAIHGYRGENWIEVNRELVAALAKAMGSQNIFTGSILTSDRVIVDIREKESLLKEYGADCVDMEGAAIAIVCQLNSIPFAIIRQISDNADEEAPKDFHSSLVEREYHISSKILHILKSDLVSSMELIRLTQAPNS
jgi:5'-methylthioadenosine/S-adenosylhomocysteine nucleosidase